MSMEDVLKALVDSRQQGNSAQGMDQMAGLVGSLLGGAQGSGSQAGGGDLVGSLVNLAGAALGGGQAQAQSTGGGQAGGGLSDMMGMLESVMGGQGGTSTTTAAANDPIMVLLNPFVAPLAKKANIPPEIAMIVVSFVAHQLLAHHPSSGRDSTTFNLEDMLQQIGSGGVDSNLLHSSGMVKEIAAKTGLDEATAEKSLNLAFTLVGKGAANLMSKYNK